MYIKRNLAFTLVELIVVIALIAIITMIALPYFHDYRAKQEYISIYPKISSLNRYARSQAAILHQNVVICSSSNLSTCQPNTWNHALLVFIDQNKNRQVDNNEKILQIDQLKLKYGNLSWQGALSLPSISYQSNTSLPIGSNGSFYYCSLQHNQHQRIVLSKMAQIRQEHLSTC